MAVLTLKMMEGDESLADKIMEMVAEKAAVPYWEINQNAPLEDIISCEGLPDLLGEIEAEREVYLGDSIGCGDSIQEIAKIVGERSRETTFS